MSNSKEVRFRSATYDSDVEKYVQAAKCSTAATEHLLRSMKSLQSGKAPTPIFKLYGREDIKAMISEFLDDCAQRRVMPSWMLEYERSRLEKVGQQGGFISWDELKPLMDLYQERFSDSMELNEEVYTRFLSKYSTLHLNMFSMEDSIKYLIASGKIETRAAGCRDFNLKKTDKLAQKDALADYRSGLYKQFFSYVFSRFNKLKPRIFMPAPFSNMISMARWVQPFLLAIQDDLMTKGANSDYTFWMDKVGFEKGFKIINDLCHKNGLSPSMQGHIIYVQRDFEKMDTTEGPCQYRTDVIPAIAKAFNYNNKSEAYALLSSELMVAVQQPIYTPSGVMVGDHGTASGQEPTNIGETLSNDHYDQDAENDLKVLCSEKEIKYTRLCTMGNGDDGSSMYYLTDMSRLDDFKACLILAFNNAAKRHGFIVQADKWKISTEFGLYCQNMYWYDPVDDTIKWCYPLTLILNSICNPEHEYTPSEWDKDYRDLDILQKGRNANGHPAKLLFYNFVYNGTKYPLLGKSEKETRRILSKYDEYRAAQSASERWNRPERIDENNEFLNWVLESKLGQSNSKDINNKINERIPTR